MRGGGVFFLLDRERSLRYKRTVKCGDKETEVT